MKKDLEILDNVNAKDFVVNAGGLLHNVQSQEKTFRRTNKTFRFSKNVIVG